MSPCVSLSPLDRAETFRYLGMTEAAAEEDLLKRLSDCEKQLLKHAVPRYTYCVLPLTRTESIRRFGHPAAFRGLRPRGIADGNTWHCSGCAD